MLYKHNESQKIHEVVYWDENANVDLTPIDIRPSMILKYDGKKYMVVNDKEIELKHDHWVIKKSFNTYDVIPSTKFENEYSKLKDVHFKLDKSHLNRLLLNENVYDSFTKIDVTYKEKKNIFVVIEKYSIMNYIQFILLTPIFIFILVPIAAVSWTFNLITKILIRICSPLSFVVATKSTTKSAVVVDPNGNDHEYLTNIMKSTQIGDRQ